MNVVWFKKDLRLHDHEALFNAMCANEPCLFLYIFEPILLNDSHYSKRHFNFIKQSLVDLQKQLHEINSDLLVVEADAKEVFSKLHEKYTINQVFSHQETGILVTYQRDLALKEFFKSSKCFIISINL